MELAPGMELAEPVLREDGVLLLPEATVLSARHLALFPSWGVRRAVVLAESQEARAAAPPPREEFSCEQMREAAEAIRPRFVHTDLTAPPMAAVFELSAPFAARVLARRGRAALELPAAVPADSLPPLPDGPPPGPMALIESDPKLTSLPDVFVRISEVLGDPLSTSQEAAEAIGMDTSLSTKLLRMVNSAFYGFPVKVDTLSRAVTVVGSRQLTTLALGLSVIAIFKDLPGSLVDMRSFWKHSIGCGVIASSLAGPQAGIEVERLFVAGLLHDVGRLVLYRSLPRYVARILVAARAEGKLLREAERDMLGFDHAILGGMLLRRWRFPENLEKAVRHHHGRPSQLMAPMPAAVHVADAVAGALGLGSSGEIYAPQLCPTAWDTLALTPERLTTMTASAESQIEDILRAFLPDEL
jgi:putative nucleotidyltransferase with HDIG domain